MIRHSECRSWFFYILNSSTGYNPLIKYLTFLRFICRQRYNRTESRFCNFSTFTICSHTVCYGNITHRRQCFGCHHIFRRTKLNKRKGVINKRFHVKLPLFAIDEKFRIFRQLVSCAVLTVYADLDINSPCSLCDRIPVKEVPFSCFWVFLLPRNHSF